MATFQIPNAPNVNSLDTFISVINRYGAGLAQACRFLVVIKPIPSMFDPSNVAMRATNNDLAFLCEQAELPGKSLTVHDARYYGPNFKYPVQTEYTDITLNFLVRDEMYEKQFFDNWMMSINPTHTYDFMYKSTYATEISIIQYSVKPETETKSHPTYMLTLKKAFPVSVAPMALVWGDENFHRIAVTFSYNEWGRIDDPLRTGYSLVTASGAGNAVEIASGSVLGGSPTNPLPVVHTSVGKGDRE